MSSGGFGVQFQIDVSSTLTTVVDVLDMDFPEFEKVLADATAHDSTAGYQEWIATGRFNVSSFKLTVGWDDSVATHAQVITSFNATTTTPMAIISPDAGETISFDGHVAKILRIARQNDVYKAEIEVQPTGQPTIS